MICAGERRAASWRSPTIALHNNTEPGGRVHAEAEANGRGGTPRARPHRAVRPTNPRASAISARSRLHLGDLGAPALEERGTRRIGGGPMIRSARRPARARAWRSGTWCNASDRTPPCGAHSPRSAWRGGGGGGGGNAGGGEAGAPHLTRDLSAAPLAVSREARRSARYSPTSATAASVRVVHVRVKAPRETHGA